MANIMSTQAGNVDTKLNWAISKSQGNNQAIGNTNKPGYSPEWDERPATIIDVRGHEADFKLDEQGFEFQTAPVDFTAFDDDNAVRSKYYKEVEALALRVTGATRAHAVGHITRQTHEAKEEGGLRPKSVTREPVSRIHVDFSYDGAWERYDRAENRGDLVFPADWEQLKQTRWACLSIWRPLCKITRDALACGDKNTVPDDMFEEVTITHPHGAKHGLFHLRYTDGQKYYYQSQMEPSEVIVLKLFDSKVSGVARCTPHTSFKTEQDDGPPRRSIETRCLVFWEDQALE